MGIMFLLISYEWHIQFKSYSYYVDGKHNIAFSAGSALFIIYATLIGGFITLAYSLFLTVKAFSKEEEKGHTRYRPVIPEYVKCPNCETVVEGKKLKKLVCTKCGGELEDLKGFFKRHREFADTNEAESIDNINLLEIEEMNGKFIVGAREFKTNKDAEDYIYHDTNIRQQQLSPEVGLKKYLYYVLAIIIVILLLSQIHKL